MSPRRASAPTSDDASMGHVTCAFNIAHGSSVSQPFVPCRGFRADSRVRPREPEFADLMYRQDGMRSKVPSKTTWASELSLGDRRDQEVRRKRFVWRWRVRRAQR